MSIRKFNHVFDLAFVVISSDKDGEDVSPNMYRAALKKRMDELDRLNVWEEAIGAPLDTYEMEKEEK